MPSAGGTSDARAGAPRKRPGPFYGMVRAGCAVSVLALLGAEPQPPDRDRRMGEAEAGEAGGSPAPSVTLSTYTVLRVTLDYRA